MTEDKEKQEFIKNYTGIYDPEGAYYYHKAVQYNKERYSGATYSDSVNRRMERAANEAAFNYFLRGKRKQ